MSMPQTPKLKSALTIFSLLVILIRASSANPNPNSNSTTVYEILPKFGLPSGLLPDSVMSYNLSSDGRFVVVLDKPCYIQFDYLVYYETQITGKLSYGSITELEGIQVRKFFFWLDVDEIRVDLPPADCIYFQVGLINKKLDVDQFQTVHSCRDNVSGSCADHSSVEVLEVLILPFFLLNWQSAAASDEIPMLVTG